MYNLKQYIPRVQKRSLLLIAGFIWGFAGFRVLTLGLGDVESNKGNLIFSLIFSSIVFYIFLKFVFNKIIKKHTKRIIKNTLEKQCVFSFFDFKSYCIMGFMIFLGITVRSAKIFNPVYVGTFYIGLGLALFVAGILFLQSSIKFEKTKFKYENL
ncbi:hypothetical protein [Clostridium butyricum]|uniref:Uncharacterized protein n=1 Tax=Clostridium butyricum E4 str. BoNT E BL5262 TaxID=632245 RepID=C4IGG4_CLOBU|nr:hypothetical protein [Clostridium butyricum]EDT75903.1 conserved hypothetical protein [Clostridium butyricum 5521]EEP54327.1 conserved hypothetical protein [Clostridium butyricum E4 str. BoNT E BL5262]NFL32511.1 hypothetical protein [Clostridium butyricum]NFS17196.1 hypothetical protein [Clostridium butyricum]